MAKKILSSSGRFSETEILGYRLPVFHDKGAKKYIDFYCWDPAREEMRRKKIHLDRYTRKIERRRHADLLIATLSEKLRNGWNPWCDAATDRQYTDFEKVLERYVEYVERTCRERTQESYRSRAKVLQEYNESRARPIRYAYEYDTAYCTEFLDHILLDREAGARTRNNYKGWCSALGEWMAARKYITHNPAANIPKLHEEPKKRQPLSQNKLKIMRRHLDKTDKYFLLACMMEYYTFIRPTELSNIRLGDIRLKEQSVFISARFSKNKRDGYVGLNESIIKLMIELETFSYPDDSYLFSTRFRPGWKKEDSDMFNKRWVRMRKALGWGDEYQFYSLKDSGIRDLANSEGIIIARDQARHTDVATTNKYLGASKTVHPETQTFVGAL